MKNLFKISTLTMLTIFLVACGGGGESELTTNFWTAVKDQNTSKVKELVTTNEQAMISDAAIKTATFNILSINTSGVESDDNKATSETSLEVELDGKKQSITFQTVLLKEDDHWKISFAQSMGNMQKPLMETVMESMSQ